MGLNGSTSDEKAQPRWPIQATWNGFPVGLTLAEERYQPAGDTIWDHKPWWCQPWSIVLSGVAGVIVSWLWLKLWWVSALASIAVLAWWGLFLVLVPRAWKEAAGGMNGERDA